MPYVLVWDIETVPDLADFAAANGYDGKSDDEIRAELGDKFPKHIYHSIVCIGALMGVPILAEEVERSERKPSTQARSKRAEQV